MKALISSTKWVLFFSCIHVSGAVYATHGTRLPDSSSKSLGMGGISAAYTQDTISAAKNPAGFSNIDDRNDLGLILFNPNRDYSYTSFGGHSVNSDSRYFLIPHFGFKRQLSDCVSWGANVVGSGGMNTDYPVSNPVFAPGATSESLGIDYAQVKVQPSLSYKWGNHALGAAVVLAGHRFKILGIPGFRGASIDPTSVTNRGYAYSYGIGASIGWQGTFFDVLTLGAAYTTKSYMSKFENYTGLFPNDGRVNIPGSYTFGLKWAANPLMNIAFDVERILYSQTKAFHRDVGPFLAGEKFGTPTGTSFGWNSIWIYKFGIDYRLCDSLIVRMGASHGGNVYEDKDIDLNIIAPATTRTHLMAGISKISPCNSEISLAYMYVVHKQRYGESKVGLGTVRHGMNQHLLAITFAWP